MSVVEPPEDEEAARAAAIEQEADSVSIPDEIPEPAPTGQPTIKDVCKLCMRPILEIEPTPDGRYSKGWGHWDPRIDTPVNVAYHVAELFEEPPTRWGFLDVKGKGNMNVANRGRTSTGGGIAA